EISGTSSNRHSSQGDVRSSRQLLVVHGLDRLDREPADPCEVVVDVVAGEAEPLEVPTAPLGRDAQVTERLDRGARRPLRELLPVFPEDQPVVDVLWRR